MDFDSTVHANHTDAGNATAPVFCSSGPMHMGTVMGMGFGVGFGGEHVRCLLFLFPGLLIDTPAKYAGAVIAAALVGVLVEAMRAVRAVLKRKLASRDLTRRLVEAALFGAQMLFAYCGMLLVMTYDLIWVVALVFGLSAGLFLFEPTIHGAGAALAAELRTPLLSGSINKDSCAAASPCCGDE
jgi:hypothetical protein